MKNILKHQNLPWLTLLCGGIGMLLRLWLLSTENEKGFITRWHFSEVMLTMLTAAFLTFLFLSTRRLIQGNKYSFNFPASRNHGLCTLTAAAGIAIISLTALFSATDTVARICWLTGLPAACALGLTGWFRWQGIRPNMLFHAFVCVWLILVLVCQYRAWSSDPQLENYCYQLLALVFAMLSVYHRATFDAGFGKRSAYAFYNLGCLYFCLLSISGPSGVLLYLCLGLWQFCNLCRLMPMPRRHPGERHEAA